ncbi:MAG: sigma-70 family RNA polymerase sigma factor [Sedimentisphaerales bacterium]|nr:sigma-70 family RNA polymerase sigma factor [Sedimentisphaerales bacterium]
MTEILSDKEKRGQLEAVKAITPQELVRQYAQDVLGLCIAHTKNFHDSEDIMQDVFIKAISKLDTVKDTSRTRSWLMQIARRMCIDYHRNRQATHEQVSENIESPTDNKNKRIENLHNAISQLPEEYREPITLYYLNGQNCSAAAKAIGISEEAIRTRLVRARLKLHEILSEEI